MRSTRLPACVCRALAAAIFLFGAAPAFAAASHHCGRASWYALHSLTASGERMVPSKLTAAHRKLDFGTEIKVVNEHNGRSVVVRINDRGPFVHGRVLDLSRAAARRLGFIKAGTAKVCFRVIR